MHGAHVYHSYPRFGLQNYKQTGKSPLDVILHEMGVRGCIMVGLANIRLFPHLFLSIAGCLVDLFPKI